MLIRYQPGEWGLGLVVLGKEDYSRLRKMYGGPKVGEGTVIS